MKRPTLAILGCRGIPSGYGGFETFAERLALYLTQKGWLVTVYCQTDDPQKDFVEQYWNGIRLISVSAPSPEAVGSIVFDWKSTLDAAQKSELVLTLGYNTASFGFVYRLRGITNIINMDGMEWRRQKWNAYEKAWLYLNEVCGSLLGNHLIADHPQVKRYLSSRVNPNKITVVPYSSEEVTQADATQLEQYNLRQNEYALIIARPEPENNIFEIVSAFSQKKRGQKLVVLGNYKPEQVAYHRKVLEAASEEVVFPGAIYEKAVVQALRYYTTLYVHGHSVGGTNPSLVEALAAQSPVLAHNNHFNTWVAGPKNHYFNSIDDCAQKFEELLNNPEELAVMRQASLKRYLEAFTETLDLEAYEALLSRYVKPEDLSMSPVFTIDPQRDVKIPN